MTTKRVIIDYNDDGDQPFDAPLDMAEYLINEFDAAGIVANVWDAGILYYVDAKHAAAEASLNGFAWVRPVPAVPAGGPWRVKVGGSLRARPPDAVAEFIDGKEQ